MPEQNSVHIIHGLASRWSRNNLLAAVLQSTALALPVGVIVYTLLHSPWWLIAGLVIITMAIGLWWQRSWRLDAAQVSSFLNHSYPQLEESTQLLLQPAQSLNRLQQMQVQKIAPVLTALPTPPALYRPLKKAGIRLAGGLIASLLMVGLAAWLPDRNQSNSQHDAAVSMTAPDIVLPGIASFQVTITPPAYTKRPVRTQHQFAVKAEEGSTITWQVHTNRKAASVQLILNSQDTLALRPANADSTTWAGQKNIREAGFYQVSLAGQSSQLYTIEVIPDLPVNIHILTPRQYSTIEPGREPLTRLSVQLTDEYGIQQAGIVTTKASGKGESVSFQEQPLAFAERMNGQAQITLNKLLDLRALGLKAGDELYFYVKATDNRGQESRSDMYFIALADTAELLSLSGMESGINQVPEYFRSQRQIIIDIEKLLLQQPVLPKDSFNIHSNVLGDDQKLLRLRYGKFLGEEWESGGHHPGDGHDHGEEEHGEEKEIAFGDAEAIAEQYAHKHDNAEDATYFEPEQKAQLKAILTEMWNSELKLRLYHPRDALPYAYKALRLLKDMQQRSRAYVSKTSIKMPPLKPEKRLTGELDKIGDPANSKNKTEKDNPEQTIQQAMILLEQLKQGQPLLPEQLPAMLSAERKISEQAVRAPADYLPALNALRSIRQEPGPVSKATINKVQAALQKIIKTGVLLPQKAAMGADKELVESYFDHLKEGSR